jgi:2-iminobutanoate/2-iminopropanoate deaminase
MKQAIFTDKIPAPIGPYSQAIKINAKINNMVFLSGQIPKISGEFKDEVRQVFSNLEAVAIAAGGSLKNIVKITVFLTDFNLFPDLNFVMTELFSEPYPARSTVQVSRLPKDSRVEIEAIMFLGE